MDNGSCSDTCVLGLGFTAGTYPWHSALSSVRT